MDACMDVCMDGWRVFYISYKDQFNKVFFLLKGPTKHTNKKIIKNFIRF